MYLTFLVSALTATALAAPLTKRGTSKTGENDAWEPVAGTETACDTSSDKSISFTRGPQIETVLDEACAAMMPRCAYQDRVPEGTLCAATIDWPLDGAKSSTQHAKVLDGHGNSISGWDVKFHVTPAAQPKDSAGVLWRTQDCYGYLAHMLQKSESEGCHNGVGSGVGSVKVGGNGSLTGTQFKVTIVPSEGSA